MRFLIRRAALLEDEPLEQAAGSAGGSHLFSKPTTSTSFGSLFPVCLLLHPRNSQIGCRSQNRSSPLQPRSHRPYVTNANQMSRLRADIEYPHECCRQCCPLPHGQPNHARSAGACFVSSVPANSFACPDASANASASNRVITSADSPYVSLTPTPSTDS